MYAGVQEKVEQALIVVGDQGEDEDILDLMERLRYCGDWRLSIENKFHLITL